MCVTWMHVNGFNICLSGRRYPGDPASEPACRLDSPSFITQTMTLNFLFRTRTGARIPR